MSDDSKDIMLHGFMLVLFVLIVVFTVGIADLIFKN